MDMDAIGVVLLLTVKFLFLFLAMAGLSNLAMAIFADVGVTVLVIMNNLILFGMKTDKRGQKGVSGMLMNTNIDYVNNQGFILTGMQPSSCGSSCSSC